VAVAKSGVALPAPVAVRGDDGGVAKSYRSVDRDQQFLMPPDMRDWLPAGHLVWFLLDAVAEMDTSAFHARRLRGGAGRAAYDPDMLLTLLIYAYSRGIRSSRQIERLCEVDVAFRVICVSDTPDHTTIARFRAEHESAVAKLFTEVLVLCARAGLARVGVVAVDGTKIAANASPGANRSPDWFRQQVVDMLAEAAVVDEAEDAAFGEARGDETPPEFSDARSRAARIRRCLDELDRERQQAEGDGQQPGRRSAAREARRARAARRAEQAPRQAEQAARQAEAQLAATRARLQQRWDDYHAGQLAAARGLGKAPDGRPPVPVEEHGAVRRARQAVDRACARAAARDQTQRRAETKRSQAPAGSRPATALGRGPRRNLTDPDSRLLPTRTGWVQGFNAQLVVSDDHIILATALTQNPADTVSFLPMMRAAETAAALLGQHRPGPHPDGNADRIGVLLADAGYASNANLTAKGPDRLIALGKRRSLVTAAAQAPATGPPPDAGTPREQMDHRLRTAEGLTAYKRRGATVEPVIGHLKDSVGLRRFSRRGLDAATAELTFSATVLNLLRLHRILPATA
jgi:transposase